MIKEYKVSYFYDNNGAVEEWKLKISKSGAHQLQKNQKTVITLISSQEENTTIYQTNCNPFTSKIYFKPRNSPDTIRPMLSDHFTFRTTKNIGIKKQEIILIIQKNNTQY